MDIGKNFFSSTTSINEIRESFSTMNLVSLDPSKVPIIEIKIRKQKELYNKLELFGVK